MKVQSGSTFFRIYFCVLFKNSPVILRILVFWTLAKLHPDYGRKGTWLFCHCELFEQVTDLKLKWPLTGGLKSSRSLNHLVLGCHQSPPIFWGPLQNPVDPTNGRVKKWCFLWVLFFFRRKKRANPPTSVPASKGAETTSSKPRNTWTCQTHDAGAHWDWHMKTPPFHWILFGEKKGDPYNGLLESQKKQQWTRVFSWASCGLNLRWWFQNHLKNITQIGSSPIWVKT